MVLNGIHRCKYPSSSTDFYDFYYPKLLIFLLLIESHLLVIYQNYLINESLASFKKNEYELKNEIQNFKKNQILNADRELRIYRLQKEVDSLRAEIGIPPKYYYTSIE